MSYSFQTISLLPLWLDFFPRYFIPLDATANRIVFLISLIVHYSSIEIQQISVILILYPAT